MPLRKIRSVVLCLALLLLVVGVAGCADTYDRQVSAGEEAARPEKTADEKEEPDQESDSSRSEGHSPGFNPYACGPLIVSDWLPRPSSSFLSYTPDSAHIVFSSVNEGTFGSGRFGGSVLYVVSADGSQFRLLVDANPERDSYVSSHLFLDNFPYGFHADLSPDGTRILYTSCAYPMTGARRDAGKEVTRADFNYEIAVINSDGSGQQRLTENTYLDQFPVWSPDGSRIAFIADFARERPLYRSTPRALYTMAPDGTDVQPVEPSGLNNVAFAPPLWSPDGEYLAFVTRGWRVFVLYTIRADGAGERTRIGRVLNTQTRTLQRMPPPVPSWSPDGELLAFATAAEEGNSGIVSPVYTARPDGSEKQKLLDIPGNVSHVLWSPNGEYLGIVAWVWDGESDSTSFVHVARSDGTVLGQVQLDEPWDPWDLPQISWSPTRPELLVVDASWNHVFLIQSDGSDLRKVDLLSMPHIRMAGWGPEDAPILAAWSPDGERIAASVWDFSGRQQIHIYTIARDGTDRRTLIAAEENGNLVLANPSEETQ